MTDRNFPGWSISNFNRALLQNRPLFQIICPGYLWTRNNRWLLSRVQWLAGPAGEGGTGAFCPDWRHQQGQKGSFYPGWWLQPEQKSPLLSRLMPPTGTKLLGPLIPFPLPPPELFSSLVLVVLGSGERSSCSFLHHIYEDLWFPRPSIGAKGLGFVFLFFLGLYSSFHSLEIEKMCS